MSDQGNRRIKPEKFAPVENAANANPVAAKSTSEARGKWQPLLPPILIGVLGIVAIAVLTFPLFNKTESPVVVPANNNSGEEIEATDSFNDATPSESPWVDSQLLRARREAQSILEELLRIQESLESMQVEVWATEEYERVNTLALNGDELYRERDFEQAIRQYQRALDQAQSLDESVPVIGENYLNSGQQLLLENSINRALDHLQIAHVLLPEDENVAAVLNQAEVRQQVNSLMAESEQLARNEQQLEQARARLSEAQDLDPDYSPVATALENIETRILERDFRQHMSAGFSALANGQYEQASMAFEAAGQLKPENSAVDGAIQQVEAEKLNNSRQTALARASLLESQEQWQEAHSIYQQLLAEDSSLSAARVGQIRTAARLELDNKIQDILDNPLSLQADAAWQSANQTLSEARGIMAPGEKLLTQVSQLQDILKNARTPVMVKLESDNMTEVEIYRVGKLGNFIEQAVNLNPGNYVIVGRRSGYRDVRIELAIDGSNSEIEVPVVCTVAI